MHSLVPSLAFIRLNRAPKRAINLPRRRAGHVRLRPAAMPCAPLHLRLLPLIKDAIGGLGISVPSADGRPARPGERATVEAGGRSETVKCSRFSCPDAFGSRSARDSQRKGLKVLVSAPRRPQSSEICPPEDCGDDQVPPPEGRQGDHPMFPFSCPGMSDQRYPWYGVTVRGKQCGGMGQWIVDDGSSMDIPRRQQQQQQQQQQPVEWTWVDIRPWRMALSLYRPNRAAASEMT